MKKVFLSSIIMLFALRCFAQAPGAIDTTFSPPDLNYFFNGVNEKIWAFVEQNDDKIIIGGDFTTYNGTTRNRIARINTDGTLDDTFNPGAGANNSIYYMALQSDGKIVIGGNFTTYNGIPRNRIARLNTNGTLDEMFNPGTGANDEIWSIAIKSDGKILIAGSFTNFDGVSNLRIARLEPDGKLDSTFFPGYLNNSVWSMALQSDGKIILGGAFFGYYSGGYYANHIIRLNENGNVDFDFNRGSEINNQGRGTNAWIRSIYIQSDGKILIGGDFTSCNGLSRRYITRLEPHGGIDFTFDPIGANGWIKTISVQNDGKILIGGDFTSYANQPKKYFTRLNMNGSIDNTFNSGEGPDWIVLVSTMLKNGKILFGGDFSVYDKISIRGIAKINVNGKLDESFKPSTSINNGIWTSALQNDGKILIGGNFFYHENISSVARLNIDGSLDPTFNPSEGANNVVRSITVQNDGNIIVAGAFTLFNNIERNRIVRLLTNGTLDPTFNVGTGANQIILKTVIQTDGKILISGAFTLFNGFSRNRIARLNTNGSIDLTFNPGSGANGNIWSISLQFDGKIIIAGEFTSYNGIARNNIARINSDGTLDETFNPGTGANSTIYTTSIQKDEKIIIGGLFSSINGTQMNRIARLNPDGSLDITFNSGMGSNGTISTTNILSDNRIIIGGFFNLFDGIGKGRIARLNQNGNIDTTFNIYSGANHWVLTTTIQNDGRIIAGGSFTEYDGFLAKRITRLMGNEGCTISLTSDYGSESQSICLNSPIKEIKYKTLGFTSVFVDGLPLGLNSSFIDKEIIISGTPTQNGIFTYTLTFIGDCTSSITNTLIVTDTLTAVITGVSEICEGSSSTFIVSGGGSYLWNNGETASSITTNQMGEYSVTVVSDLGCVSKGTKFLIVNPKPLANISGESDICFGPLISWTASGGVNYVWNNGATSSSVILNNEGTYTVTVTDINGCTSTSEKMLTITSNPPAIISGQNIICQGKTGIFSTSGGGSYKWSSGANTPSITVSQAGEYFVTVTSIDGCISTGSRTLSFFSKPSAIISGESLVCQGMSETWTGNGGVSYIWSTGRTTSSINLTTAGTYTVTVTDINGCTASSSKTFGVKSIPDAYINGVNENCDGSSSLQWAKQFGGNSEGGAAYAVITDKLGNVYSTGQYYGGKGDGDGVDFDPGPDVYFLETGSGSAAYISKLDKDGNFVWAKSIGSGYGVGTSLILDDDGNLYATGTESSFSTFLLKIDMDGAVVFEKYFTSINPRISTSIVIDKSKNIYVSYTSGNIEKYNNDGNFIWEKSFGYGYETRIGINKNDNIYIAGGKSGISVAHIDTSGIIIWEKSIDGSGLGENNGIKIDNNDNIYITGYFKRKWDFDPGPDIFNLTAKGDSDAFVLKLDKFGNFIWATQFGGEDYTWGISITVDEDGFVYNSGSFEEITDFDPGPEEKLLTSIGYEDGYILKLDSNGKFVGVVQYGSEGEESAAYSIAVDNKGYIYSTGYFAGKVDFNPSNEIYNLSHIGSYRDFFVVKLCKNFNPQISSEGTATFCEGGSVTLSSSNAKSYLWSSGETSQNIVPTNSGTYTVTITNSNGCTNSASKNIIEALKPIVSIDGESTICNNNSVTWTANGGISYLWNTGSTIASINPTIAGSYTVTAINDKGCTSTATKILDFSNDIIATITGITKICEGNTTTLSVSEGTTFLWSTNETSQSINVSSEGVYVVTVTNENGCSAISLPTTITIYPLPVAMIVPDGSTTFCLGENVILTATEAQSYIWNSGQTSRSVDITYSGVYVVTVTDANGCSAVSSDTLVTVNPLITSAVTILPSANAICAGDNVTFTSIATNSGPMPVYQWYVNGNLQAENGPVFSTTTLTNNEQVLCRMTSNAECLAQSMAESNIISIAVNPLLTPEVTISTLAPSVLACQDVSFTPIPTNGGISPTYQWFLNGNPVSSTPIFSTSDLINGDQVSCIMTSSATCKSTPSATSNTLIMSVSQLPQPTITISGDTISSGNYKDTQYLYSWYFNGNEVSKSPYIICNQFGSGSYYLVINYNRCTDTSNTADIVCTVPTNDIGNSIYFMVYPNPTNNVLNISGINLSSGEFRIEAYNMLGQKLEEKRVLSSNDILESYLDMSSYASGIYTVALYSETYRQVFKVYKIE
ncbi:MAG: T9SS type A sorting domain-containing protein [Saprospiraceae bacterium]|nr:T9SS type A sorting domain-containing protein [Saprospiraceae bacterium]MBP6565705.1 T9SS type A sorting domain-containing protein [Saprospiraceae bacterium]